jgi:hypothetical protein
MSIRPGNTCKRGIKTFHDAVGESGWNQSVALRPKAFINLTVFVFLFVLKANLNNQRHNNASLTTIE